MRSRQEELALRTRIKRAADGECHRYKSSGRRSDRHSHSPIYVRCKPQLPDFPRQRQSMVQPHAGRGQSAIPRSLLTGPYERKPTVRLAKIKSRPTTISKARVYEPRTQPMSPCLLSELDKPGNKLHIQP